MQTIIILLDSEKLENPDLDLRYYVPDRIEEITDGKVCDNGYDYVDGDKLAIWLSAEEIEEAVKTIVDLFKKEKFMDNDLSLSAEIYVSENDTEEFENCRKVYEGQRK